MKENPNHSTETQNNIPSELPKPPNDYPPKKSLLGGIGEALGKLGNQLGGLFGSPEKNGPNKLQEFFANILGFFHGVDIEKGITIKDASDVKKVREAFGPLINLDDTSIEWKVGDFIIYDKESGVVNFYPADKTQKSGHALDPNGIVRVNNGTKPLPKEPSDDDIQKYTKLEKGGTALSYALGDWLTKRGPAKEAGANMCGRAVHFLLKGFGLKNAPRHNGNEFYGLLKKDKRFKEISVNSLDEIPPGAIVTYSGKGTIDGKPNGSVANQKYGHVEIKGSNDMYYSFYASKNPGGSAAAPKLHNNFEKWKQATGLQGVFVPVSKV